MSALQRAKHTPAVYALRRGQSVLELDYLFFVRGHFSFHTQSIVLACKHCTHVGSFVNTWIFLFFHMNMMFLAYGKMILPAHGDSVAGTYLILGTGMYVFLKFCSMALGQVGERILREVVSMDSLRQW